MQLGNSLFEARKKTGFSQEEVAEKLGVSRQTISKWETGETVPDLYQSRKMAQIYRVSLDALAELDGRRREIQELIETADEKTKSDIDWTRAWAKKYPILAQYQEKVESSPFAFRLNAMLDELREAYGFSEQDAVLVLKDLLYTVWKERQAQLKT